MRIIVDFQAAQSTGSRNRGIGRYATSLLRAMARTNREHEILIVLNGLFPETIEPIRETLKDDIPDRNIRVWYGIGSAAFSETGKTWSRQTNELIRQRFIAELDPDFVLITSLFEGLGDDAVTTIKNSFCNTPTAVILYDLIPFIYPDIYLSSPTTQSWYFSKLKELKAADLWLSISDSSRQEGILHLGLNAERSFSISTDADAHFNRQRIPTPERERLLARYNLNRPFVMYTGGIDHRKNIEGLIAAYARLPKNLRKQHQLAVVCSINDNDRSRLDQLGNRAGLGQNELVLTGFVPESDLIGLYRLCKLFVFPSWHEGFGLPALEAMRCGAPVIGANTSSLPEVIGWSEALFDPRSQKDITHLIQRGLSDERFAKELRQRALKQIKKFSWIKTAEKAFSAIESLKAPAPVTPVNFAPCRIQRKKLAFITPYPPDKSGIANYSLELLESLSLWYEIDVFAEHNTLSPSTLDGDYALKPISDFVSNSKIYDRILYQFGNSPYHNYMFELLENFPGVVTLHDFFLSGVIGNLELQGLKPFAWRKALYHGHGYSALIDHKALKLLDVIWKYPCSLGVLQNSLGTIVHSRYASEQIQKWYGRSSKRMVVVPHLRKPVERGSLVESRNAIGLNPDHFVVCTFGHLGSTKLNDRLLSAWKHSKLAEDPNSHLVFVGELPEGDYREALLEQIASAPSPERIRITGWTSSSDYHSYLQSADIGVQLRTLSRGETSGAILDCMNHGIPVILNDHGSSRDIPPNVCIKLKDDFAEADLVSALERLWTSHEQRKSISDAALELLSKDHAPEICAQRYFEFIESIYSEGSQLPWIDIARKINICDSDPESVLMTLGYAEATARTFGNALHQRQLLVDVSELIQRDSRSGIQRVVHRILTEWLYHPPKGFRVEPIYATPEEPGYRYARGFTQRYLQLESTGLLDHLVDAREGDLFIGLDFQPQVVAAQAGALHQFRQQGVKVKFVVYDLLPVQFPEAFYPGDDQRHAAWLKCISEFDGACCISKTVAEELREWLVEAVPNRMELFKVGSFYLGSDPKPTEFNKEKKHDESTSLSSAMSSAPSFLMVGTVEPRKGHAQVLAAFEVLWAKGLDLNLIIAGKEGWRIETVTSALRSHPRLGKNLWWFDALNDEDIAALYDQSSALIAASLGEGFGLPLVEAARHKLPIIARDIPVFREVAEESADYFKGREPEDLARHIENWIKALPKGKTQLSETLRKQRKMVHMATWKESADSLLKAIGID